MKLRVMTAAGACALGLFAMLPQGARAQGAPPVTVRVMDAPVDTPPPVGTTYIRVGDHEIEVGAPVQVMALKTGMKIMLPDGAPPLPAEWFDATTLPDGHLGYVCKTRDKVTVIFAMGSKPSPVPAQFAEMIEPVGDAPQPHLGTLSNGDAIMSIPYRYKRPIRMTDDLSINGLFGTQVLAKKDEVGFDAGEYRGDGISHRLLCFFSSGHGYKTPNCFVKFPSPDGSFGLAGVVVSSNLPTAFQMSRYQVSGVKAPPVATDNVTIDHDFHLDLLVGRWTDSGLEMSWRSEGLRLATFTVKTGTDGTVRYHIEGGTLVMRSDPNTGDKTRVEFVPDPASAASPASTVVAVTPTPTTAVAADRPSKSDATAAKP